MSLLFLSSLSLAQGEREELEGENEHESEVDRHTLFLDFGWTYMPNSDYVGETKAKGFLVPTIGLDYLYKIPSHALVK